MRELMRRAARLGVQVHIVHIEGDETLLGYYSHKNKIIVLRLGLTPCELRSVLAHELSHAEQGDVCSGRPSDAAKERRADRHAAEMLISPEDYAAAEALDPSTWAIAEELGVTQDLVETYQAFCLQRLGRRTYGRSWGVGLVGERARYLSS